jgi:hypothetical protein
MERDAIFDSAHLYRYSLWRRWSLERPSLVFVLLNPSQASADTDDPTLRRCLSFAQDWGYGSLEIVNLFAWVTTCPQKLKVVSDPIGPECDRYLLAAVAKAERIVVAWGNGGQLYQRDRTVLEWLSAHTPIYCLGLNRSGQPRHPLYLPRIVNPLLFC